MAEFILKYQNSTPPRFRRKPSAPGSGKISENSGSQYNLGSHITMPKTPNLLTKSRKRSVACKSTAEVEEEEATKFEQYVDLNCMSVYPGHTWLAVCRVACLYSGTCIPLGHNQLVVIQRWSAHTVEPVYGGHP